MDKSSNIIKKHSSLGVYQTFFLNNYHIILPLLKKYWLKFGSILGYINTRIILSLIFILIIIPISLIMKIFGKQFLEKKINKKTPSYWISRTEQPHNLLYQF